jgi:hypothetical protein
LNNNLVYRNWGNGIAVTRGIAVEVTGNVVYDNFSSNVYIDNSRNVLVDSNFVYCDDPAYWRDGRPASGIALGEEQYSDWGAQLANVTIQNNIVAFCKHNISYRTVEVSGGGLQNVSITHNTLWGATRTSLYIAYQADKTENSVIANNIIQHPNGDVARIENRTGIDMFNNFWVGPEPESWRNTSGPGDLWGDVQLKSTPDYYPASYNLSTTSPAIDAGTGSSVTDDFFGNPRVIPPDMGAIEFQSEQTPVNQAPIVDAGEDRIITLPASIALEGFITDDNMPDPPGTVATTWSAISSADVTFGNPSLLNTTASFPTTGTYVLQLTADDGELVTSDTVTIEVLDQPTTAQPPIANDDIATTDEDTPITIDLLANDTDADGTLNPSTVMIMEDPANGSATIDEVTGAATYTPNPDFNGPDSFSYAVQDDAQMTSNPGLVSLMVNPINDPPLAADDSATVQADSPVTIDILANDTDTDGHTLSLAEVSDPLNGSAQANADNSITYTPGTGFTGADSFTYVVSDGFGETSAAKVTVTVSEPPDQPGSVSVASISYDTHGGRNGDKHLNFSLMLVDESDISLSGASVTATLVNTTTGESWHDAGTSGENGIVAFSLNNAPSGCYEIHITSVTASAETWDGTAPASDWCKEDTITTSQRPARRDP